MTTLEERTTDLSSTTDKEFFDEQYVLYGPIGSDKYLEYARQQIVAKYGSLCDSEIRRQRIEMWQRYERLLEFLKAHETDSTPIIVLVQQFIKDSSGFAKNQLEETPPGGLGIHLKEVHEFTNSFLLTSDGVSRFAGLISDRDANLMGSVVADIHDLLKFLGSMDAQIIPDHAVMTAELIDKTFVNKKVAFADGSEETLTNEDVEFVAGVVGDHENIEKEEGRSDFIKQDRIARAKALFFVIDVLTGSLQPVPNKSERNVVELQIDTDQLWSRFGDLYLRHMDPTEGKIFRPQWGSYALGDLFATFDMLEQNGLNVVSPDGQAGLTIKKALKDVMSRAISLVLQAQTFHEQYNDFVRDKNIEELQELSTKLNESKFGPLKIFREKLSNALNKLKSDQEINPEELLIKTLTKNEIEEVEMAKVKIDGF